MIGRNHLGDVGLYIYIHIRGKVNGKVVPALN
jgi:hypothetical protein